MLYNGDAIANKSNVCGQEETHTINQEQVGECLGVQMETFTTYQNKEVRVVLEFPNRTDAKAEDEFISRLKEIYLRKIELGAWQEKESALESNPINRNFGSVPSAKEDKNHG